MSGEGLAGAAQRLREKRGGGARIDHQHVLWPHQGCGPLGDSPPLLHRQRRALVKDGLQPHVAPGGAAIGPVDHLPLGQLLDVAPDGLGGHAKFFSQLRGAHGRIGVELGDNGALARILLRDAGLILLH
jgi:hypothetical protein